MANNKPAFCLQITVDSNNKWCDTDLGNVSMDEGTYDDVVAAIANLEGKLQAVDATFSAGFSTSGKAVIARGNGSFDLDWSSGAHSGTNCGTLFGYDITADDTGAATYTADYFARYTFLSEYPPEFDSWDRVIESGPEGVTTMSGLYRKLYNPTQIIHREMTLNFIKTAYFHPTYASGTDNTFGKFWELAKVNATPFELYTSWDTWASAGTYYLLQPENIMSAQIPRIAADVGYYGPVHLLMLKEG